MQLNTSEWMKVNVVSNMGRNNFNILRGKIWKKERVFNVKKMM